MKRNRFYNSIIKKHKIVRTVIEMLDEDLALKYENWLMEYYHTWINDPVATEHACNIDGPGTNGKYKSSTKNGKTYIEMYGVERAKEIGDKKNKSNIGKHSRKRSQEEKDKIKMATIEAMKRPEIRQKITNRPPITEETRDKIKAKRALQDLSIPVYKIDKNTNEIIEKFSSMIEAYRKTGTYHISEVCTGKRKIAGGFKWQFASDKQTRNK